MRYYSNVAQIFSFVFLKNSGYQQVFSKLSEFSRLVLIKPCGDKHMKDKFHILYSTHLGTKSAEESVPKMTKSKCKILVEKVA